MLTIVRGLLRPPRPPQSLALAVRHSGRLVEVGKFTDLKPGGRYEAGQLFLHRVFGYRGAVLFPWTARVYDRDRRDREPRSENYYQVLVDTRDGPHVRSLAEAVTFLGASDAVYVVPGLDHVAHPDILPYSSGDRRAVQHELYDRFLLHAPGKGPTPSGSESLRAWRRKHGQSLERCSVHMETTERVRVTVIPFYLGRRPGERYWWRYSVRLENMGAESVRLRGRVWRVFAADGGLETVRGRGVVGLEPLLDATAPAFQYSSHVSLPAPSGHMWGTFALEREDGYTFDCKIPHFPLESWA